MKKKCVIIGSGLGGLSSGVIMAKNGYDVTILEQSQQIGGCLQCFTRNGAKFETGMHFAGSLDDGQILSNYFNFLEIKDKLNFSRLDSDAYDIVSLNGEHFRFPNGREKFVNTMAERFPDQRENLELYCDLVEKIASASPYRFLNETTFHLVDNELQMRSLNEVIEATITDPILQKVLVGNLRFMPPNATRRHLLPMLLSSIFTTAARSALLGEATT